MQFRDHVKKQNLEQLVDAWEYLTPAQRLSLRVQAQAIAARHKTAELIERTYYAPIRILNNLHAYTYPAHWAEPFFSKKKNTYTSKMIYAKIFIVILVEILAFTLS